MSSKKKDDPPKPYARFKDRFPRIAERYEALGDAVHDHGPLNDRELEFLEYSAQNYRRLKERHRAMTGVE